MTQPKADKSQKQKFIDTARELGADEDEKAFADKLKKLAQPRGSIAKPKAKKQR
jgi:hypothetical protein